LYAFNRRQTATKRIVLCCACVGLASLAIVEFGIRQQMQAAKNTLANRQGAAAPTKTKPKFAVDYGKLPISFEANQGQTDSRVRFLAHGGGYTIFLTGDEAVLALKKSSGARVALGGEAATKHVGASGAGPWPNAVRPYIALPGLLSLSMPWEKSEEDLERPPRFIGAPPSSSRLADSGGSSAILRMRLIGANARAAVSGADELPGKSNYFIGNDPKKWRTNVSNYSKVKYQNVYPGVDLVYYGNPSADGQLEYDFVVASGADPSAIVLDVGAVREPPAVAAVSDRRSAVGTPPLQKRASRPLGTPLQIAPDGDLVVKTDDGEVRFHKPLVYQPAINSGQRTTDHGQRAFVDGQYILSANNRVGFKVAAYDHTKPLIIDPVLSYSTYLGGSGGAGGNGAWGIAVDSLGNTYVTGMTSSDDFPTVNPIQASNNTPPNRGYGTGFVAKLNAAGSALIYSTYLGGSNLTWPSSIALDAFGNAYVTGLTSCTDFPTVNPFQASNKGGTQGTGFVAKLNATGSALVYSSYLGGSDGDWANGIAVDSVGSAYVTGNTESTDFPTVNPLQGANKAGLGNQNAFVAKVNAAGTALVFSTYLGGTSTTRGVAISVDQFDNAYVAGGTASFDFPTVNPVQSMIGGGLDAFVAKLNAAGSALIYSTFLGGSGNDQANAISIDSSGNAYVAGYTYSPDFPTVNALQGSNKAAAAGNYTAFVAKLNSTGSALVYSTYLGGSGKDSANGMAADSSGNANVTGVTSSTDFPTVNPLQATNHAGLGNSGAFVAELNPDGSALVQSTYLSGSAGDYGLAVAVDPSGNAYVSGLTLSVDFPTANALQPIFPGGQNPFVAKISGQDLPGVTLSANNLNFAGQLVNSQSAEQAVMLIYAGPGQLSLASITASGDFGLVNTATSCPYAGGTVPSGIPCTIDVVFTPTTLGNRAGSLTVSDNVSNSPQTVALIGTGSSTDPEVELSTSSLNFGNQALDLRSTPLPIKLTNAGNMVLTITSITVNGDFTETNNCANTLSAGANCTINVVFTPIFPEARNGLLTITDNSNGVANSTQSVALSGTGQDFAFAPPSGSPTTATVAPGSSATYTLSVGGEGGFSGTVSFTCAGAPSEATCTVSPNSVTAGSSATNVTVTVTTTAPSVSAPRSRPLPPVPPLWLDLKGLLILALVLATMAWAVTRRNQPGVRRWQSAMVSLAAGLLLTLALAGCGGGGGGGSTPPTSNPGTPAGNYTLTVTGTAGSGSSALSHNVTLTLTVS
jgi:hypothetical protein